MIDRVFDHAPDRVGIALTPFMTSPSVTKDAVSLESYECRRLNQGEFGACGGHGSSAALFIRYGTLGRAIDWIPSPLFLYQGSRAVTRATLEPGDLDVLQDSGVQPTDMRTAIETYGLLPMAHEFCPDGRRSDVDDVSVNQEIALASLEEAARTRPPPGSLLKLDATEEDHVDRICAFLDQGIPVGEGLWVDRFFQASTGGVLVDIDRKDPTGGWHWVTAVAYRSLPKLGRIIKYVNSWGDAWGDGTGHIEIAESRLRAGTADSYAFTLVGTS